MFEGVQEDSSPPNNVNIDMLPRSNLQGAPNGLQMQQLRQQEQHQQVVWPSIPSHEGCEGTFFEASEQLQPQMRHRIPAVLPHDSHHGSGVGDSSMTGNSLSCPAPPTLLGNVYMIGTRGSFGSSPPSSSSFPSFQHPVSGEFGSSNADRTSNNEIGPQMSVSAGLNKMDLLPRSNAEPVARSLHTQQLRQHQQVMRPSLPCNNSGEGNSSGSCQQQQILHMIPSDIVQDNCSRSEANNSNNQESPTLSYAPPPSFYGNVHLTETSGPFCNSSAAGSNFSSLASQTVDTTVDRASSHKMSGVVSGSSMTTAGVLKVEEVLSSNVQTFPGGLQMQQLRQQLGSQTVDTAVDRASSHKMLVGVSGSSMTTSGVLKADEVLSSNVQTVPGGLQIQQLRQQQSVEGSLSGPSKQLQELQQQQQNQQKILLKQQQQQQLLQRQQHHHQQQQQILHQKQQHLAEQDEVGFTRHQLSVLRSQILAFRRIKKNERLSDELLRSISPLAPNSPQNRTAVGPLSIGDQRLSSVSFGSAFQPGTSISADQKNKNIQLLPSSQDFSIRKEGVAPQNLETKGIPHQASNAMGNKVPPAPGKQYDQVPDVNLKSELIVKVEPPLEVMSASGKSCPAIALTSIASVSSGSEKGTLSLTTSDMPVEKTNQAVHRHWGPLFDFPHVSKRAEGGSFFSALMSVWGGPVALGYDVRVLLLEEGVKAVDRKRSEKLKKIERLLDAGSNSKGLHPDHMLKLRIEQRKLRLMELQSRVRDEVEEHQQEIMAMGERAYRKFVRLCGRQRADLLRHVIILQKSNREKQLKSLFQWRKKLLETQWSTHDSRISRNRGVAKYHERMLREFSKRKDEDRTKRMEALKNNDVVAYREMLRQQQTQMPGDAGERFEVLSSFLTQTEEYLQKLGGKISAVKNQQEQEEAAIFAAAAARAKGFSEEEIAQAAACAGEEVLTRDWPEDDTAVEGSSVNRYYSLVHAVNEKILKQPSMLRAGQLRDYQLVGLQWMLSLYNNRLNGILADEMGLGKTVQVMALIAYLMEFKGNYGPHLIIVPNAVMVNWKSELLRWLPSVSCIFYVGGKDARTKIFTLEVTAMKFNILVTTYEFIMRDRAKLSKVDWKYMIIDEAQRMKDRESRLARDLDRFRCQRRLLLTGTPLQNDLNELWSLLNLLLPDVFDSSKAFNDWFAKPFQRDGPPGQSDEDDWLETEKKVIVIHRLHQILEPFMLRRRVEDVEGSLPVKVSVILKCKMSGLQAGIYDWVKATGTIRLDPLDEAERVAGNSKRQIRAYAPLQNKCMELRKICNHPYLNYPPGGLFLSDSIVRCCGKLWILDRILMKLHRTGHRVLLFSTMTRLLDILEEYLQWRRLKYRRIDGTTTLDAREAAIVEFNRPNSEIFLFLLSIRAAGRGLNLQTADTVVIYDPDPNPKNEEQAVARAHRIGQKREVRVIYMEAVVETIASYQKEDEIRSGGTIDSDDEMAGKDRYVGSVESLVRNNIQQHKIDMADEVINAGRFDQRTSQEERRLTLEALLHDEERYQETVHDVPTLQEVNRMIARTDEELELFDQMDEEEDWPGDLIKHKQIPTWLRVGSQEVNAAIVATSKQAMKQGLLGAIGTKEEEERVLAKAAKAKALSLKRKAESDEDMKSVGPVEFAEGTNKQKKKKFREVISRLPLVQNDTFEKSITEVEILSAGKEDIAEVPDHVSSVPAESDLEEGEMGDKVQEDDESIFDEDEVVEEPDELGHPCSTSSDDREFTKRRLSIDTNCRSSLNGQVRRFGSLAALEGRPFKHGEQEDLEEGEIAVSGEESPDTLRSESWGQDRDDGEGEQVVQPSQRKRKRSSRNRRMTHFVGTSDRSSNGAIRINPLPTQFPRFDSRQAQLQRANEVGMQYERPFQWGLPAHLRQLIPPSASSQPFDNLETAAGARMVFQPNWGKGFLEPVEDTRPAHASAFVNTNCIGYTNVPTHSNAPANWNAAGRMQENQQKKCKAVLGKLQGAVNKEGRTIAAMLMELPKCSESPDYYKIISRPIDAHIIEHRLDHFDYPGVLDFAADVQLMLDNAAQYNFSSEVQADARRLQALFFQRMGLQFPDVDFSPIRVKSVAVPSHATTGVRKIEPTPSLNLAHRKRESSENADIPRSGSNATVPPTRWSSGRQPVKQAHVLGDGNEEETVSKGEKSKKGKNTKNRAPYATGDKLENRTVGGFLHPVDLVVHKKKRNGRERVASKTPISRLFSDSLIKEVPREQSRNDGSSPGFTGSWGNSRPLDNMLPKRNPSGLEKGDLIGVTRVGRRTSSKSVPELSQADRFKHRG